MAAIIMLPILPSVLIYKILPNQRVMVKGQFGGLQLNATGAFGGYVFLVFVANSIVKTAMTTQGANDFETWSINGTVALADPADTIREPAITLFPPSQSISPTGSHAQFRFVAPVSRIGGDGTAIQIAVRDYLPASFPLGLASQRDPVTKAVYKVSRDPVHHVLNIEDTLFLKKPPKAYQPTTAFNPQLLPNVPHK